VHLVVAGDEEVEEGDDGALKLRAARGGDGVGRKRLPDDGLADVCGDEQADAGAQAVALLQQLVQADDDDARKEKLRGAQKGEFPISDGLSTGKHFVYGVSAAAHAGR